MKQTQKQIVFNLVKEAGSRGIRTEQVEIQGLHKGISGGSSGRYLRWLQEETAVESCKKAEDRTHTWYAIKKDKPKSKEQISLDKKNKILLQAQNYLEKHKEPMQQILNII